MSKRKLPRADLASRPGARSEVMPSALDHWNPAVRAAEEPENTISILDVIGEDMFGDGVTARRISAALRRIGEHEVTVTINSPGGDFFEGLAIYNLLREHPAQVNVRIVGIAASAASVIAMAGDEVRIARAGFLMIHNTWVLAMGDRHALREVSDWLEPFDQTAVDIYAARSGIAADEVRAMLDRETWIGGSDAVEQGFADELLPSDAIQEDREPSEVEQSTRAELKINALLAKSGIPKAERRKLTQELRGTSRAAQHGTSSAAVVESTEAFLRELRSLHCTVNTE